MRLPLIAAATLIILVLLISACRQETQTERVAAAVKDKQAEQDLRITFGGFVEDHPEGGKLEGVCGTDYTRNVLNCDIYNGLLGWTVTEFTIVVTWSPYKDEDKRYYRTPLRIEPFATERCTIRLGVQLPPDEYPRYRGRTFPAIRHWSWLIASAKGHRVN